MSFGRLVGTALEFGFYTDYDEQKRKSIQQKKI